MYVYAFEPVEYTFNLLRENLADLANVLPCRMAVSDHSSALFVTSTKAGFRTNHLCQENTGKDVEKICGVTIDEFADMHGIKSITLLKIDVEGLEPRVLRGLHSTKTQNILIEICQNNLEAMGSSIEELYDEIRSKDLYPYMIEDDGTTKQRMTMSDLRSVELMNVALR
jgi:FkbM family methyltransferase